MLVGQNTQETPRHCSLCHTQCRHHVAHQRPCGYGFLCHTLCAILTYLVKFHSVVASSRLSERRKQEWVLVHLLKEAGPGSTPEHLGP